MSKTQFAVIAVLLALNTAVQVKNTMGKHTVAIGLESITYGGETTPVEGTSANFSVDNK